ncbi:flavin reductase family protein [Gordonia desulfuricans]|uniref:Flavin reductase family protein n=1 Tax=Gordonia desulfuricans TaxID=89051 RepID=A0A7K3LTR7_9ACTN|nr:flavin reductase family protein [Gordonia desulfuricans]NDK91643.1 flavin reductase family protein [Gordonia desulfuricans]
MNGIPLDGTALRHAFAHIPAGVVAICAEAGGERMGMAASSFVPVSLDPPLVAFCVQNTSSTWPRLAALPRLGISVLSADHAIAARSLAAKSGDRFADVDTRTHDGGAVFIEGCGIHLDVTVEQELPAGDHRIVLMRVHAAHSAGEPDTPIEPIVFHRSMFRTLVA